MPAELSKTTLTLITILIFFTKPALSQNFFKDYLKHLESFPNSRRDLQKRSCKMMKKAFNQYEQQTKTSVLIRDTLFIVYSYNIETAERTNVVWNRSRSISYSYRAHKLTIDTNAQETIMWYLPKFRRWVESADTASYDKFGKQSSWFDAPRIWFTVAVKLNNHWNFITSGSYSNNIYRLK